MTVGNPENFKVQIKTGREEVDKRTPCDFTNLTLKKLFAWIDSKSLSSVIKSELKRSASSFPHQALPSWQSSFDRHLSRAQARIRKKKNFVPDAAVDLAVEEEEEEELEEASGEVPFSSGSFADPSNDFDDPDSSGGSSQ